eukprot:TRINITY_DN9516_c0_g1_i1.p1 TRINITY_DN9516_c0_g1~~TRINITY_DN9516_c0_g1_i1.p1  ORF type:complete len:340 (+),score=59.23 TRINITY_DN9516_c0_g1_i1:54-1022(+)
MASTQTGKTALHVFDFDGTLFKSPLPNPKYLSKDKFGKLRNEGGWFHLLPSLTPPAVPTAVPESYWIEDVKKQAETCIKDDSCTAIVLTGRGHQVFYDRIVSILEEAGLTFENVFLKPKGMTTLDFKKTVIRDEIKKGGYSQVYIYEDRIRHVEKFTVFLEEFGHLEHAEVKHIDNDECTYHIADKETHDIVIQNMISLQPDLLEPTAKKNGKKQAYHEELKAFLASSTESLVLPEMSAFDRKSVHTFAENNGLSSTTLKGGKGEKGALCSIRVSKKGGTNGKKGGAKKGTKFYSGGGGRGGAGKKGCVEEVVDQMAGLSVS